MTRVINKELGGPRASAIYADIYEQIRRITGNQLRREPGGIRGDGTGQDLTTVAHTAWLRLQRTSRWQSRAHFFGAAAIAVRRVLVDEALKRRVRRKHAPRIGDRFCWMAGDGRTAGRIDPAPPDLVVLVNELIDRLNRVEARWAQVASMRYFLGLQPGTIARAIGVDVRTVERDLKFFRAWLRRQWALEEPVSRLGTIGA